MSNLVGADRESDQAALRAIIEVHRQEVAGVIREQRIHPHGVPAGEVVEDRLARDRDQRAVLAVAALDPWLLADAGAPLGRAGW